MTLPDTPVFNLGNGEHPQLNRDQEVGRALRRLHPSPHGWGGFFGIERMLNGRSGKIIASRPVRRPNVVPDRI